VGRRRGAWRLGTGPAPPAGGGHHRPGAAAEAFHLVPAHQPGSPGLTPRPADPARRDRCRLWAAQLGGAGHKQVKDELGWADFQVRGDRAIRRHWTLACLAFSFCWHAGQAQAVAPGAGPVLPAATAAPPAAAARGAQQRLDPGRRHRAGGRRGGVVAAGTTAGAWLAGPVGVAAALLAWMVDQPAAPAVAAGAWLGHGRTADLPPPPAVINKLPLTGEEGSSGRESV
jgi:hypothetical protein